MFTEIRQFFMAKWQNWQTMPLSGLQIRSHSTHYHFCFTNLVQFHTVPHYTIPHHTTPHHSTPHAIPPWHHTTPHAIPHHIPPCHTIPHHMTVQNKFLQIFWPPGPEPRPEAKRLAWISQCGVVEFILHSHVVWYGVAWCGVVWHVVWCGGRVVWHVVWYGVVW